jgi:hypothetical protein
VPPPFRPGRIIDHRSSNCKPGKTGTDGSGGIEERRDLRVTRSRTGAVGAAEGSIISAVIVAQDPRYQPNAPRLVWGPASMPRIRSTVPAQATAAAPKSRTPVRAVAGLDVVRKRTRSAWRGKAEAQISPVLVSCSRTKRLDRETLRADARRHASSRRSSCSAMVPAACWTFSSLLPDSPTSLPPSANEKAILASADNDDSFLSHAQPSDA